MIVRWLVLPSVMSPFERSYLAHANRVGLFVLLAHLPILMLVAWANETRPLLALALTAFVLIGPLAAVLGLSNPRHVSMVYGAAAMALGGLLVHFGQGPLQIEMHFYFFVLLAVLSVFGNPAVVVTAAASVLAHHIVFWHLARASAFGPGAPIATIAVHGGFVFVASIASCFLARSFFDNVIGLEKIIADRTHELAAKERDLQTILDNVEHGFCTIGADARLASGRSAPLDRWFGVPEETPTSVFDLFARKDREFAVRSRTAWHQVDDDILPLELTLAQMPRELRVDDRILEVGYKPIESVDARRGFLVIVSDKTEWKAKELVELERRELLHVVERLASDRSACIDFFDEASALVIAVREHRANRTLQARAIHTLKGNAMLFGLESVSAICEDLETALQSECLLPDPALERLERRWAIVSATLEPMIGVDRRCIRLPLTEQESLEAAIRSGAPNADILRSVHAWRLEPMQRRLELCKEHLGRLASQRDIEVDVSVDAEELSIEPTSWAGFWSAFIHVLRNVVSHGIEPAEQRLAKGKSYIGRVALESFVDGEELTIAIRDDGPGIAWDAIADRARSVGLPATTRADLERALFSDGISTAAETDGFAGRGVGASALLDATQLLGGRISVESEAGEGACFRFIFPRTAMDPSAAGQWLEVGE